ncbi:Crp/Fnr family transcriptional regulator [Rhizobium leguminosarum]|uniref:Crp/Fnr family transcriptional regulator n=1 Tax=Rhizobium leguminosarum TaxID=384 RepID=UPI001C90142D|nr:Crp/Fnr family transcriptional regulator [Rhizobium leguminosarum]MBY3044220.1 Crp/Fnr family transcriptional regulator [Rhizobium leguminosarum]
MRKTQHLISKLEQFTGLGGEEKQALEDAVVGVIDYRAKEDIILQGDRPDHVHLLASGWACRYKLVPDGGRQIMAYLIPGDLCDVQVALLDRMDHSISALSACEVYTLPLASLSDLMNKYYTISRALWWSTLLDEAILREWLVGMGRRSAEKRLGHLICEMWLRSKAVGLTERTHFEMAVTQEDLADTMGITPEHMSRCFQTLRGKGLISTDGRRMTIGDLDHLIAFSDFDPLYLHQQRKVAFVRL